MCMDSLGKHFAALDQRRHGAVHEAQRATGCKLVKEERHHVIQEHLQGFTLLLRTYTCAYVTFAVEGKTSQLVCL